MRIFKILTAEQWRNAKNDGVFKGSDVDLADGFIHFSTAGQVRETAARHFGRQTGLVLIGFDLNSLGPKLVWEPSRGGQLFPHLFATLDPKLAVSEHDLPFDGQAHVFPEDIGA